MLSLRKWYVKNLKTNLINGLLVWTFCKIRNCEKNIAKCLYGNFVLQSRLHWLLFVRFWLNPYETNIYQKFCMAWLSDIQHYTLRCICMFFLIQYAKHGEISVDSERWLLHQQWKWQQKQRKESFTFKNRVCECCFWFQFGISEYTFWLESYLFNRIISNIWTISTFQIGIHLHIFCAMCLV